MNARRNRREMNHHLTPTNCEKSLVAYVSLPAAAVSTVTG